MIPAPSAAFKGASPWVADPPAARGLGLVALAAAGAAAVLQVRRAARRERPRPQARPVSGEARALHGSAALLAASVLADSATEHYRGGFKNPGMYAPLVTAAMALAAGISGALGASRWRRPRTGAYVTAGAVGAAGTGFHLYNLGRRPGGWSWLNLFYSAPVGAPAALSLAGLLGLAADRVEPQPDGGPPKLLGLPAGRALVGLTGLGIAGTVGEAGLLHFRGAFQNPFMYAPVSVPPVAAALMLKAAASPGPQRPHRLTRTWLGLTAVLGLAGVGFHAYGVSRAMGGWRNWTQNLIDGPPLPAPPSFAALAIAALAALSLMEREHG
ncbi:MAG TPA: hypothetical protein VIE16_02680 [Phenylobacterium sp.]|jgi:hypothetical protein